MFVDIKQIRHLQSGHFLNSKFLPCFCAQCAKMYTKKCVQKEKNIAWYVKKRKSL